MALGQDPVNEQVTPIRHTGLTWVAEWAKYAMNRSIGRPGADLYMDRQLNLALVRLIEVAGE